MCGIFGFSSVNERTRAIAPFLAFAMQTRGDDSWGMTDSHDVFKSLGHITKNFHIPDSYKSVIVHTRAASVGTVTLDNQHPFTFDHIVGIHNGTLTNPISLDKEFNRDFDVDSMHLFANLAEKKPFDAFIGTAVMVWYDNQEGVMKFCRANSDNLEVVKMKTGEIVFCSSKPFLEWAVELAATMNPSMGIKIDLSYVINEYQVYKIVHENETQRLVFVEKEKIKFPKHGPSSTSYADRDTTEYERWFKNRVEYDKKHGLNTTINTVNKTGNCVECDSVVFDPNNAILCHICWQKYMDMAAEYEVNMMHSGGSFYGNYIAN